MSDLRLRARPVAEIVDAAFQLYRRDAAEYLLITALAYAPALVAQLLLLGASTEIASFSPTQGAVAFVLLVFSFFTFCVMWAALTLFASEVYLGRMPELGIVARAALGRLPAVLGSTIAFALVLALGAVPVALAVATANPVLIAFSVLLPLAWWLYAYARYFALLQIVVLERADVVTAFRRSALLSRNIKLHILLTMFLVFVIVGVLSFAVLIPATLFGSPVVAAVVQTCYVIAAYPLIGITQMVLYYDARIRAEGFDIEVMAQALGPAQTPERIAP